MNRRELFKAAAGAAVVAAFPYSPPVKELVIDFTGPGMTAKEALKELRRGGFLIEGQRTNWIKYSG